MKNKYIEMFGIKFIRFSYLIKHRGECIKYLDKKKFITCDEPIIYFLDRDNKNEYLIIPPRYEFDFNSSPCFAHCIVDRDEYVIALVHDVLYTRYTIYNGYDIGMIQITDPSNLSTKFKQYLKYGGKLSNYSFGNYTEYIFPRKVADKIWLEGALVEDQIMNTLKPKWKTTLGYYGIRIGGFTKFKSN